MLILDKLFCTHLNDENITESLSKLDYIDISSTMDLNSFDTSNISVTNPINLDVIDVLDLPKLTQISVTENINLNVIDSHNEYDIIINSSGDGDYSNIVQGLNATSNGNKVLIKGTFSVSEQIVISL
jgi:hypothetical protein